MLSHVEPIHFASVHCFTTGKANVRFTDDNIQLEPLALKLRLHERFIESNKSGKKMKTIQARSGSFILRLADRFMEQVPVEARSNHCIQRGSGCEVAGWVHHSYVGFSECSRFCQCHSASNVCRFVLPKQILGSRS